MNHPPKEHAQRVVESFSRIISASAATHIGQKHMLELQWLIESAIANAVHEELQQITHQVDKLSGALHHAAKRFEPNQPEE
ncbi:hypothetical protein WH50_18845 [Pokkaliibacter plantistimulans]|uniref:Phosphatase n=1 Tax=Pokkaliibacter plantistimulans TaxID=1635171 RepID=A0ABX5LWX5_9GAMM|nr:MULTISPECIES: phosphatase [Pokkaliibacter]MDH2431574.1 phosphatase [Pokkaliibacter sp. MBI-7]PXF29796.1 hypothetical protein WH50_18845 [Pokkaliibacter plantistimulans]